MKSLISVNHKFMELNPKELINQILEHESVGGLEVYVDCLSDSELKYLDDLVFEVKRNNLVLQIHANCNVNLEEQIKYFKKLEQYSDYLESKIIVTIHSLYDEDKEESIKKTVNYVGNLINSVNNDKLVICLENLNDAPGLDRLEKECVEPLILNDEKLYFTYDMGHEMVEYGDVTDLSGYLIEDLRNIHLHTHDIMGYDHYPIYKNDKYWNEIMKCVTFLVTSKYEYNIVYEYNLYECKGETLKEKVEDYLNSIDFVSEHYSND